ncbi:CHAT domain-containing protein [Bradyrhizobium jicamae]|uniref:CHAT domain-containing protein n=1 Tax=Bradyrhizobium jicamae TaxID=280332 RepID=UPI000A958DEB|nr:CHAT domain-containing protein [Bradyrhizobium jicamae]
MQVASYLVPSLTILWGVLAPLTAAAQNAGSDTPKNPADFRELVLARANPDSLATDYGGAWSNIYQYLIPARFIDRHLYEEALLKLASTDGHGCEAAKERQAILACEANIAADVALSLTAFAENVLFRRDAVAFAESITATDPGRLIDTLLNLAHDEWTHGLITEAEAAVHRAAAIIVDRPESANHERRMRLAVLKALLADAHLDDGSALAALSEAINAALSKGTRSAEADPRGHLSDLVTLHLRGRFCPNCGRPVAEPVKRWLTAACQNPGPVEMLQILAASRGTFSAAEMQACARRYIQNAAKEIAAMGGQIPARADDVGKARLWALSRAIDSLFEQPKILKFLREADPRRQAAMPMKEVFDAVVNDDYGQHGEELAIARVFEQGSWHYENGGLHNAARITLEYLVQYQKRITEQQQIVNPRTIRQARVIVSALARLAALQLAAGDRAAAARSLDDASAIAQAKLREEWDGGGERAILAMRDLSDALRLIAQTRHELIAPARFAENAAGGDALFRAMQAAITGETALTLEIAQQRRVLSTPRLAGLKREHKRAASEASRMAEFEKAYAAFNYDQTLTRVRREAEARRDQVAAELGELPGPPAQTAAEIEPVALADARSHLAKNEALVLLRVGNHSLDGFLLDRDGRTLVWRSPVRQDELEALVRSLRTGADMVDGKAPKFPVADAARLHEIIFGPIKARLGAYRKLIMLGDGPLQSLPYGILLTGAPANPPNSAQEFRAAALPWLVRTHAIALVPSVRNLVAQRSGADASRASRPFLGVGNPQLASMGADQRNIDMKSVFGGSKGGLADVAVLRNLASLPETEDELRYIAKVLNADPEDIIVGPAANETALKALPLTNYRIITFATHGALAGEVAGTSEPGLVLTPPPLATAEDDGFLGLSEIASLKLDADLIILSACNTGTSDGRPRAESLSGLARGFFNAGARGLLVTHWTIPSESAVKTTTGLVAARARDPGMDWADALREATLAIIDREGPPDWAHPSYWGAYVAVGVRPAASADAQQTNERSQTTEPRAAPTSERSKAATAAQDFPDAVLAAAQSLTADCRAIDQPANSPAQFVRSVRFAGGTAYVIDTQHLGCMAYCGTAGCVIEIWAHIDGAWKNTFSENVRSWRLTEHADQPALHLALHGSACGRIGAETCRKTLTYRDGGWRQARSEAMKQATIGETSPTLPPTDAGEYPCSAEPALKSVRADTSVNITFQNRSKGPISTYWLDYSGRRILYQRLAGGASYTQQTFVTHPWVLVDDRGRCRKIIMPGAALRIVTNP